MWLLNKISCEIQILNEKVWKLMIENGRLEKENRKLKEDYKVLWILNDEIRRVNENLREENKKLKEDLDRIEEIKDRERIKLGEKIEGLEQELKDEKVKNKLLRMKK